MKTLITLTLCCLSLLGFGQSTVGSVLANPLPKGTVVANGNAFAVKTPTGQSDVYFNGTSLSGDAINWETPRVFADRLYNDGINLVRFHHMDANIGRQVALADALYERGLYFCFDVVGDRWIGRKVEVYEGGAIRNEMVAEMDRLKPLLRHPGLAYVALVNEAATPLRGKYNANFARAVEICNETYAWFKEKLLERGYSGLVADLPDANIDARFAPIVAKQDMLIVHGYGTHNDGQKFKIENWAQTSVHLGSMLNHIINLARKVPATEAPPPSDMVQTVLAPKPAIIQEFACMYPAPDRAMNEVMWRTELLRRGISVCSYAYATNQSQLRGTHTEVHDFGYVTDPSRMISAQAGALLVRYGRGVQTDWFYGPNQVPPVNSPNYRYATDKVSVNLDVNRGLVKVKASSRKLYFVVVDQTAVRGLVTIDAGNGWRQTTNRGGLTFGTWVPAPIDCGAPVSGAYQNGATLKKSGNLVWPVGSGLVEVNLR